MSGLLLAPHVVSNTERQAKAVEMRIAGKTLRQIASELGYCDEASTWRSIKHAMDEMLPGPCERLREILTSRLEVLWAQLYPRFEKSCQRDPDGDLPKSTLELCDRLTRIVLAHGKLAGLEQQGELVPADDEPGEEHAALSAPKTREEQLAMLIERMKSRQEADRARKANTAVEVTQVVEHQAEPETNGHTNGSGSNQ